MEWNATEGGEIPAGTVCPIDGDYLMFSTYWPTQSSVYSFRYAPKFLHRMAQLDYLPFYFKAKALAGTDDEGNLQTEDIVLSTYPYTGNIQTIADVLAGCLNNHGDLGEWSADCGGLSKSVTASINFDGATVKSAATAIADAFGTECRFVWSTKTIRFGTYEEGKYVPEYGNGSLVNSTDSEIQYNTFRILGGTRNMSKKTLQGKSVQVTQRLMLEGDSIMGGGNPKIMKDLVFDDIYPKMELWMYDVHERRCWLTDENGKKIIDSQSTDPETGGIVTTFKQYSKWYFKLARWNGTELVPYVLDKSLLIEGMPLSMVFQPNHEDTALPQPLVGREFELTYFDADNPEREKDQDDAGDGYQPVTGEFRIIYKVDGGMILPSTSAEKLCPYGETMSRSNNKVTLTNVAMDEAYVEAAKEELREAGEAAVEAYRADKSSFTYLTYGEAPEVGGYVTSVRQNLITGEVQYTIGNSQSSKGLIGRLSDKIDTISAGSSSPTTSDGNGTWGGGVSESIIPILSQLMGSGSVTKDTLTILKELLLGTNGHGVKIDANGDASMTIGSLRVTGTTHLSEIEINHIKHTGGMMVVTKAQIIVDHVEHLLGGMDKLYFRRMDASGQAVYNQFETGDLALMMVFNESLDGSVNRYYWREVSAIDDGTEEFGWIILLPSSASHAEPRKGDVVVQLGHTTKPERQGATVLGGSGPNGGFIAIYDGIRTWRDAAPLLDDYDQAITYISPKKNKLNGDFISLAGTDLKGQIDALRGTLNSVRDQSDKQLVIWYGDEEPLPNSGNTEQWNTPAMEWHEADTKSDTTEQQVLHLEDVYYLRRDNNARKGGRAWQWVHDTAAERFLWFEITDADTLASLEASDHAVATAEEAKLKVESLADDGVISAGTEKSQLLIRWQDTVAEYAKYIEQAEDYGLDKEENGGEGVDILYTPYNEYCRKYHAVAVMLNGGREDNINSIKSGSMMPEWLVSMNTDAVLADHEITAEQYRGVWRGYSVAKAALLKAIESCAKQEASNAQSAADNAQSSADNAQSAADNAQSTANEKKRVFSTSPNELPPVPYDEGDLWLNATWYTVENEITTYRWKGDSLYCTHARSEGDTAQISDWSDAASGITSRIENLGRSIIAEVEDRKNSTEGGLYIDSTTGSLYSRHHAEDGSIDVESVIQTFIAQDNDGKLTGKMLLKSDNVVIESGLIEMISGKLKVEAGQVDFSAGQYTIDAEHVNFTATDSFQAAVGNSGVVMKDNLVQLMCDNVENISEDLGMVMRVDGGGGEFSFGSYEDGAFVAGLTFKSKYIGGKLVRMLVLSADSTEIASDLVINGNNVDFGGSLRNHVEQTVDEGLDSFTVLAKHIGFTAADLKIKADDVNFDAGEFRIGADHITFSGKYVDLTAANVALSADQINFEGFEFSVKADKIDFASGALKISASNVDFSGEGFSINAKRLTFEGRTEINDRFVVHEDGHLQLDWLEATNVKVNGIVASPFVKEENSYECKWDGEGYNEVYYAAMYHDNMLYNGLDHHLYWNTGCSGRLITLCFDESAEGNATFNAPEGKYFYEDGLKRSKLTLSRQCVILKGFGTDKEFWGYIVVKRIDIVPKRSYGREIKCLAFGTVQYGSNGLEMTVNKTYDGRTMSCERLGTGVYKVSIPLEWNVASGELFAMVTALGTTYGSEYPIYASVKEYVEVDGVQSGFVIQCGDDPTRNDGTVQFMLYNKADWNLI